MNQKIMFYEHFKKNKAHLHQVALRMLGSQTDADDAVQEVWLRLEKSRPGMIGNFRSWLVVITSRICLDMLRSRKNRWETLLDGTVASLANDHDAERDAILVDSVGEAMVAVSGALPPMERVVFILHDVFDVSYDDVARIIGRSKVAARQIASRARRRLESTRDIWNSGIVEKRRLVEAFKNASEAGDYSSLLKILDPKVVLHADTAAVKKSGTYAKSGGMLLEAELVGAQAVAMACLGRMRGTRLALVDGEYTLIFAPRGVPGGIVDVELAKGLISKIFVIADKSDIAAMNLVGSSKEPPSDSADLRLTDSTFL